MHGHVVGGWVLGVLVVVSGCSLPCSTTADCPNGWQCQDERCALEPALAGGGSSSSSSGGSSSSSGGTSSSSSSSSSGSSGSSADCPLPALVTLVRSNDGATTARGLIRRWALKGDGSVQPCTRDLTERGSLDKQSSTVGWIGGGRVAYGTNNRVVALDAATDTVAWTHTPAFYNGTFPLSISLSPTAEGPRVVVSSSLQYSNRDLTAVELLDPATGELKHLFKVQDAHDPMSLGSSAQVGLAHPVRDGHLLYVRFGWTAMMDVVMPLDGAPVLPAAYLDQLPQPGYPEQLGTAKGPNGLGRIAVTHNRYGGEGDNVWLVNDPGTGPTTRGPFMCVPNSGFCASPLEVSHAVPDPTHADRVFITCQTADSQYEFNIVRVHLDGTCDTVLDGTTLPVNSYPYRLAIAQD